MPPIQVNSRILVTGADGFIGSWLVQTLLEQGYAVRATVLQSSVFLTDTFGKFGDKFEQMVVEDISKVGAFDKVVAGIDGIVHLASPVSWDIDDPKDIIEPATNGTVGILKSVLQNHNFRRIVIISSLSAARRETSEPIVINEEDWNEQIIQKVERLGRNATGMEKYMASKTLAEKAAWAFYHEHQARVKWDMVTILPAMVIGPTLVPHLSPQQLNESLRIWYNALVDREKSQKSLMETSKAWIDVRDLALFIVKSLLVPEAGSERILASAGSAIWQDWLDAANALSPSPIPSHAPGTDAALPTGSPEGKHAKRLVMCDTSKAERILCMKYKSMEETARDTLANFERRGW